MRSRTFLLPLLLVLHACGGDGSGGGGDPADTAVTDAAPPADSGPVGGMSSDVGPGADAARTASLAIEPVEVDLGRVGLGQEAETTVLLRNTGDADLTVTTFAGLQTPFASSRMPPLPIGAGQTRMLAIQFSPEAAGPVEQVVTFETEPPLEAAATLTLRGEGISAEATLVTEVVDFGVVAPGEPTSRPLQLRNDSVDTALQITGLEGLMAPFDCFVPKHHRMYHLLLKCKLHGNPTHYATQCESILYIWNKVFSTYRVLALLFEHTYVGYVYVVDLSGLSDISTEQAHILTSCFFIGKKAL
jgi:hypothetical protein